MISRASQDYLKQIYLIGQKQEGGLVPLGAIARSLQVTPGTVTTMVKGLFREKLVAYIPRRGVKLTTSGEKLALKMIRRHRLVELFLVKVLGLGWSEVHLEAEELEHSISDRVLEAINELLESPHVDPHGDPIPDEKGNVKYSRSVPLAELAKGERAKIVRVEDQDAHFLQFLENAGIELGKEIEVKSRSDGSGAMVIRVNQTETAISMDVAKRLGVGRLKRSS